MKLNRKFNFIAVLVSVIVCLAAGGDLTASAQSLKNRTQHNQTKQTKPKKKSGKKSGNSGNSGTSSSSGNSGTPSSSGQQYVEPYLYIDGSSYSPTYTFTEDGGGKYATVSANQTPFIVSSYPSWIHPQLSVNNLYIKVDPSPSTIARNGSFTLGAGSKRRTIYIKQEGASYLYVENKENSVNINFSDKAEGKYPRVATNRKLSVDACNYSWIHPEITGNNLYIAVEQNQFTYSRYGYFMLKAGNKTMTIHIHQDGKVYSSKQSSPTYSSNNYNSKSTNKSSSSSKSYNRYSSDKRKYPYRNFYIDAGIMGSIRPLSAGFTTGLGFNLWRFNMELTTGFGYTGSYDDDYFHEDAGFNYVTIQGLVGINCINYRRFKLTPQIGFGCHSYDAEFDMGILAGLRYDLILCKHITFYLAPRFTIWEHVNANLNLGFSFYI